jgi:hypothetical protein
MIFKYIVIDFFIVIERLNIKVVTNTYHNPFLLSAEKEKEVLSRQEANIDRLVIPRRYIIKKNNIF